MMTNKKTMIGVGIVLIVLIAGFVIIRGANAQKMVSNPENSTSSESKGLSAINDTQESTDLKTSTKYKTEAEFLNHPDGVKFQVAAYKAVKAYLSGDLDELAKYISDTCAVDAELDIFKDIDYLILKWSLADIKAEDKIHAAYEFQLKGEDSVSYVSMELVKLDGEWKVDFIGVEK